MMHNKNVNKKYFQPRRILPLILGISTFIASFSLDYTAHAVNAGMAAICVPQPKFSYLFKNLNNFQSNISIITGTGTCQWNVNGIQVISFELSQTQGKYAQQRALDNLTHADPFNKYVDDNTSNSPLTYKNHFTVSVCATTQLACVEHIVIDNDRLLDIKDINESSAALDYFSIRRNLQTLAMFIIDQYSF